MGGGEVIGKHTLYDMLHQGIIICAVHVVQGDQELRRSDRADGVALVPYKNTTKSYIDNLEGSRVRFQGPKIDYANCSHQGH